jgi:DNA-binding transcriptional LysR family regulator
MDKIANMQAFAVVGTTGSFAEAARRLGLANSVVSKRIKDLEDFLGVQLFLRTTRKVSLTEAGYQYLEYVRRILDEMDEVEAAIRYQTQKPVGTIKMSAPLSFGLRTLAPAIAGYLAQYPEVEIKTYLSDRRVDLVEEGFDLAIRIGKLDDLSLIARKLCSGRRVACASPAYFKKHGTPKTPADLKDHNCLSYINLADGKAWPFMVDGKRVMQPVSGNFLSDNGDLLCQTALAGGGITLLPTFIIGEALQNKDLKIVLEEFEESDFDIYAVYQHTRHLSVRIRTLIDHLSQVFKNGRA